VGAEESSAQIFQKIASAANFPVNRLRITKGSDGSAVPSSRDVTVHQTGLRNRSAVDVKDLGTLLPQLPHYSAKCVYLGPQIAWRTVFIVEYLGPLLIHPLVYYNRSLIYGTSAPPSQLQTLSLILVTLHFLKREY
jgi:very-long-chain enoyl-CoA reductase